MVYPRRLLHITINKKGEVSCWDDRERANIGKESGDVYVPLLLTLAQTEELNAAKKKAGYSKKHRNSKKE